MILRDFRINLLKLLVDFNERIFFERKLLKFYKQHLTDECKTVVDIGANKGQSVCFFLKLNPNTTIYSIEPNPVLFELLKKRFANNPKIRIFNVGISEYSGERIFFENVFDYTSTFEELNPNSEYLKKKAMLLGVKPNAIILNKYLVKVESLDQFVLENDIKFIDILKIDTEGHEYYCLKGFFDKYSNLNVKYIQIENHNDDMYKNRIPFETINNLLVSKGFKECKRISHSIGKYDEVIYLSNNFVK